MLVATLADTPATRSRIGRSRRRLRSIALVVLGLPLILAALGATYEAVMAVGDMQRYPPPGKLVDVGGRRLHLHCSGPFGPAIILEAGHTGTSIDWTLVQQQLAGEARVCSYDRAGSGWSDPGPLPRTPERIVDDLHRLLEASGEQGPYTLVGHSLGGRYVRLFAERYPEAVAGMVLVDARSEYHDQALAPETRALLEASNRPDPTLTWLRRLGVMRAFGPRLYASQLPGFALLPPELQRAQVVLAGRDATVAATGSELAERERSDGMLQTATLGDRPLWVLASTQTIAQEPTWLEGQRQQASRSTNSVFQILDGGHYLQLDTAANVSTAIREVVQRGRR